MNKDLGVWTRQGDETAPSSAPGPFTCRRDVERRSGPRGALFGENA
jgi:hypothetical protein